jgi:DNA-binding winged helix-turn-helix (wHTH) protein
MRHRAFNAHIDSVPAEVFAFGTFELHPGRRLLMDGGKPVPIGSRALAILTALVERAGELVSRMS